MNSAEQVIDYPYNLLEEVLGETPVAYPSDIIGTVDYVLCMLTEREKRIILQRYRQSRTYQEIARDENVTRERIRQIEQKALRKLKHPTRAKWLEYGVTGMIANEAGRRNSELLSSAIEEIRSISAKPGESVTVDAQENKKSVPIEQFCLSVRSFNVLKRAGCNTLDDIAQHTPKEIMQLRNMGSKSFNEIMQCLRTNGYPDWGRE